MKSLALLLLFATLLPAQNQPNQVTTLVLSHPWRFHPGDDPRWKDPRFDDSAWTTILPTKRWTDQGVITDSSRYAWYRLAITANTAEQLYLWFPDLHTAAEVFVNGTKVMQHGVPGNVYLSPPGFAPQLAALPRLRPGDLALIAVRIWLCRDDDHSHLGAGIAAAPELGPREPMQRAHDLEVAEARKAYLSSVLMGALGAFLTLVFLFCWWRQPNHPEYGWYAGMLLGRAVFDLEWYGLFAYGLPRGVGILEGIGLATNLGCSYFFFRSYFGVPRAAAFRWILGACLILELADFGGWVDWWVSTWSTSMLLAGQLPILTANAVLLYRQARKGNREAWALAIPYFLYAGSLIIRNVQFLAIFSGVQEYNENLNNGLLLTREPFYIPLEHASLLLGSLAMAAILLDRFTRTAQAGERMAKELEAARQVQELLLPSADTQAPGFAIERVYLPANEVGGDFYQILPIADGSGVLLVVGDVSGKGLRAAMIVSAAVGAIGMTATREPAALLTELNRALAARVAGGFVTCCAVLISNHGAIRLANAGHIAPYIAGHEVEIDSGLPLGLSADFAYTEATAKLVRGDSLMLVSDGVVEAANAKGELFGFDRTRDISGQSARQIAEAARAWGQNDDITVVTVRRTVP